MCFKNVIRQPRQQTFLSNCFSRYGGSQYASNFVSNGPSLQKQSKNKTYLNLFPNRLIIFNFFFFNFKLKNKIDPDLVFFLNLTLKKKEKITYNNSWVQYTKVLKIRPIIAHIIPHRNSLSQRKTYASTFLKFWHKRSAFLKVLPL